MKMWEAAYIAGIVDGEGSITLTRMHTKENRRACISIPSNDKEMLKYIQSLVGGSIYNKKNYHPKRHRDSYTLYIKKKKDVFRTLREILPFLRIKKKKERGMWILSNYDSVTPRNGKYNEEQLLKKKSFEEDFFAL